MTLDLMLACPSSVIAPDVTRALAQLIAGGSHLFDMKWDGVRCAVVLDGPTITLINRNGENITLRYPDIVEGFKQAYPADRMILDGELLVIGADGKPSYPKIHKRDAQQHPLKISVHAQQMPATFVAFDILEHDGRNLRNMPLTRRLTMLDQVVAAELPTIRPTGVSRDGEGMWQFVLEHGMEGLVAKHEVSLYVGKRSRDWIKIKRLRRIHCVVTGYDPGEGGRLGQVGALHLAVFRDGRLVPIGRAGTGFKARDHGPLLEMLHRSEPFVAEVEFFELSSGGQLRFPSFKRVRPDVELAACTFTQITGEA